jgi:hypothetical protein
MQLFMLPQVQWEPVRTLDPDQDIMTLGWFPTPLASANDGGPTLIGARSQRLVPYIPGDALQGTYDAYSGGTPVTFKTTLPFGLVAGVQLEPKDIESRPSDLYQLTRPEFVEDNSLGGLHVTARAEGGRPDLGGVSPGFKGVMVQLINGVDLASGIPLGLSVLGSTADPGGSVETIFNNDMTTDPRVPVTRFDLSGYGGSNFSDWNDPFAAFAQAAKVQFQVMVGRTALEVIKVNSVLHPWGIRVTRSITVERRPGGGVIRRDSGWQAFTPGLFDYRYLDQATKTIKVAPYTFDAGVFRGLFNVRSIRPAAGTEFSAGIATMVPYYFDADLELEGMSERTRATGVLGYLQVEPSGEPASVDALRDLLVAQGSIGGPIDAWIDFGGSGLPFRARRIEIGLAFDGSNPIFVATVRGVPKLPTTGSWSVVKRPVAGVTPGGGEATPISESLGVPLIRRYPIRYKDNDDTAYNAPPLDVDGSPGDYRFADAADLLVPSSPANDYALIQSTPTHAFLFPRPYVLSSREPRIQSEAKAALADIVARSTSKGSFPPPQNTIELPAGSLYFDVKPGGLLALSKEIIIAGHPVPLRIAGSEGNGSALFYDDATLSLKLQEDSWSADFSGLRIWTDIMGINKLTGAELRVVGSTNQRPQIAELRSLVHDDIEKILAFIPLFGARGVQGPIDLGASNSKHETYMEFTEKITIPEPTIAETLGISPKQPPRPFELKLKLYMKQSAGFDGDLPGIKASAAFGANLEGKIPVYSWGVATVFIVASLEVELGIEFSQKTSAMATPSLTDPYPSAKADVLLFVGIGVESTIGIFEAKMYLGFGFKMSINIDIAGTKMKWGGLVALEAVLKCRFVDLTIRGELRGLLYEEDKDTKKFDWAGSVKLEVEIFMVFSINTTYQISGTKELESWNDIV